MRFVVNAQCAVSRAGCYLMIVRGEGVRQAPGVLAFPGGKVEVVDGPDSVLEAAVRREVREETAVIIAPELKCVRSANFTMADGTPVVTSSSSALTKQASRRSRHRTRWPTSAG